MRLQSKGVCKGGTQITGTVKWCGRAGLGEVDRDLGQGGSHPEPLKSLQGTAHLGVFNAFTYVPHDTTALAILEEG